tara:strand:+ start:17 stop:274 length:258 start_codon:yes stop_codon:yes gene_type:complete
VDFGPVLRESRVNIHYFRYIWGIFYQKKLEWVAKNDIFLDMAQKSEGTSDKGNKHWGGEGQKSLHGMRFGDSSKENGRFLAHSAY